MCLGIPVKIVEIKDQEALVEVGGLKQTIRTDFVPEAQVGDYVIVHAGFAISVLEEEEARETLELLKDADVIP
ncbi:MAG: HypC/HybG/HupF family hydrogenase formation chaperone [Coprothermobacterota bacterium]|jgi:hydrogenase expression/formation protein HypC|nr:HypC/HybG/HupF family hydrogenase formation chaperone [Caldisericota bacterium]MDI6868941.1 HypC/HybG/HupF family hydrogenase formation chaperone [Coprothermobacterota bacterium]